MLGESLVPHRHPYLLLYQSSTASLHIDRVTEPLVDYGSIGFLAFGRLSTRGIGCSEYSFGGGWGEPPPYLTSFGVT
jgi:hypothetical protein